MDRKLLLTVDGRSYLMKSYAFVGFLAIFVVMVALTACNAPEAEPSQIAEPPAPDAQVAEPAVDIVTPTATVLVTATTPTETITATAVITVTLTVTPEVATVTTLVALRIRAGPGLQYPEIGLFAEGAEATIMGRSEDALWLKIECPVELNLDECWVIGDDEFVEPANAEGAPVTASPAVPTPAPSATPTAPIVSIPTDWVEYRVRRGDTLSGIASSAGVSAEEIQAANGLADDAIVADTTVLFVPPGAGSSTAGDTVADGTATDVSVADTDTTLATGADTSTLPVRPGSLQEPNIRPVSTEVLVNGLTFTSPHEDWCKLESDMTNDLYVGTAQERQSMWQTGQVVGICLRNFESSAGSVVVTISAVNNPSFARLRYETAPTSRLFWYAHPNYPAGEYTIAVRGDEERTEAVMLTDAGAQASARLVVRPAGTGNIWRNDGKSLWFVQAGGIMEVVGVGFPQQNNQFYLCKRGEAVEIHPDLPLVPPSDADSCYALDPASGRNGGYVSFPFSLRGLPSGVYAVIEPDMTGSAPCNLGTNVCCKVPNDSTDSRCFEVAE